MNDRGFFSRLGAALTTVRVVVSNVLFLVLVVVVLLLLFSRPSVVVVPHDSALVLNPRGALVDQRAITDSLASLFSPETDAAREVEVGDLLKAVDRAAADDRITMLVLRLDQLEGVSPGYASTIGAAVGRFRAAGKQVVAYGNYFSQGQYLLASFADAVYMHPMGQVLLPGYGGNNLYFKGLLDKLNVKVNIFRVGRYKEFVEPWTRSDMSDDAREANQALVDGLWANYADVVQANRKLPPGAFEHYTQSFPEALTAAGDPGTAAVEALLVDELLTPDAARSRIASVVGYNEQGEINGIGYRDYLGATSDSSSDADAKIGVITATGPVVTGSSRGAIAADRIIEQIRRVRRDEDMVALVLRLNTPGGSSFASELIRQELELVQLAGKPVVVSMSNVAASGGYWISSTADRIVAQPTTITGSIGVFGIVPTFEKTLDHIGVSTDGVATTPLSGADPFAGLTPAVSEILQAGVEQTYDQFVNLVARGRNMPPEKVNAIAQGRVWIGSKALELGLVDELGTLADAVRSAASLAEVEEYEEVKVSAPLTARELLLKELLDNDASTADVNAPLLDRLSPLWRTLLLLDDPRYTYALCETCGGLTRAGWW